MNNDWHEMFGTLRSMLNTTHVEDIDTNDLWQLIQKAHTHNPDRYNAQWLPYIETFPRYFERPLGHFNSVEALEQAIQIVPFACWSVSISTLPEIDDKVVQWLQSPYLDRLRGLTIVDEHVDLSDSTINRDEGHRSIIQSIVESPTLRHLETLRCQSIKFFDDGATAFASAENLRHLTTLEIIDADVADIGIEAISKSSILQSLTTLSLHDNMIDVGARSFGESPQAAKLRTLDLGENLMYPEDFEAFSESMYLENLTTLIINDNIMGDVGAKAIVQSPYLKNVETLWLGQNQLTKESMYSLAESPNMASLTFLQLSQNEIDDEGAIALAQSPYLGNLNTLLIDKNDVTALGKQALAQSPYLSEAVRQSFDDSLL